MADVMTLDECSGDDWTLYHGDAIEVIRGLPSDRIHYQVFSPPFESLFTYSNSDRDMGNSTTSAQFWEHYRMLIAEQWRVAMPGRHVSIHAMNLPTSKVRHGVIGLRDFRGEIIRAYEDVGFIYHSEVCIWKDPVTAMQRTKALGLLHKQLKKDSCMSRMGIPDYVVTMRKSGDNPERVTHSDESFPVREWQKYASPIWMDIDQSDTLEFRTVREDNDERHLAPLQIPVIERCLRLWTNPHDVVLSPFAGIGSEGYAALRMGRRFIGIELKRAYWERACKNLREARASLGELFVRSDG
jgi:hypothetical protein